MEIPRRYDPLLFCDGFWLTVSVMTLDLSCFEGNRGQTSRVRHWHGTYLLEEDACYDRGSTTKLRRFLTNAVVGPKIVDFDILCGIRLFLHLLFDMGLFIG